MSDQSDSRQVDKNAVAILSNSAGAFDRYQAIANHVADSLPGRDVWHLATNPQDVKGCISILMPVGDNSIAGAEAAALIRQEFGLEPAMLYTSDLGYQNKTRTADSLVVECLGALRRFREVVHTYGIRYLFMPGGGSAITNALFMYAQVLPEVICYRVHPLNFFNLHTDQRRYGFSDSNERKLPVRPPMDLTSEQYSQAMDHARRYVKAVREGGLRPDAAARQSAGRNAFTPNFHGMLRACVDVGIDVLRRQIKGHAMRTLPLTRMLSWFRKLYLDLSRRKLDLNGDYFIFVLHHPKDSQLLFRGRHFIDQMALCRLIASNLPYGTRLFVKEHPIYPGMMPVMEIRRMQSLYPAASYVDYSVPFSSIVGNARGVLTINSTAGLEAAVLGKPVVTLGESFYRGADYVYDVEYFGELTNMLKEILVNPKTPDEDQILAAIAHLIYYSVCAERNDKSIVAAISRGISERANL